MGDHLTGSSAAYAEIGALKATIASLTRRAEEAEGELAAIKAGIQPQIEAYSNRIRTIHADTVADCASLLEGHSDFPSEVNGTWTREQLLAMAEQMRARVPATKVDDTPWRRIAALQDKLATARAEARRETIATVQKRIDEAYAEVKRRADFSNGRITDLIVVWQNRYAELVLLRCDLEALAATPPPSAGEAQP